MPTGMTTGRQIPRLDSHNALRPDKASKTQGAGNVGSSSGQVTIGIGYVEEALAPFGIVRCGVGLVPSRDDARMERVNIGMIEDNASPPRPILFGRSGN
jgi:hypothetical protein